jgi:hypothetical protein
MRYISDFVFTTRVAVIPPDEDWDALPPRSQDGFLHPDCYWYGIIEDLRGRVEGDETVLWVEVSWFYTKENLEGGWLNKAQLKALKRNV